MWLIPNLGFDLGKPLYNPTTCFPLLCVQDSNLIKKDYRFKKYRLRQRYPNFEEV